MDNPAAITTASSGTLASSVYQQLRADILKGQLTPGSKLRLQYLADKYNVGNSPLREALNRLSTNGLVTREENKGFRVSPASMEELLELIQTRCWLEETALRESLKKGDEEWEEGVVLAFHRLNRLETATNGGRLNRSIEHEEAHRDFHLALLSACGSSILLDFCRQLQIRTFRYRNLGEVVEYRDDNEGDEHRAIHDAVLARDTERAVELLHAHYTVTLEIITKSGALG